MQNADDTTILIKSDTASKAIISMNRELEKLCIWLTANKLSLNISKIHYMVFDRGKEQTDQYALFLNNILIDRVKYTKFETIPCAKVIIDEKLIGLTTYLTSKLKFLRDLA